MPLVPLVLLLLLVPMPVWPRAMRRGRLLPVPVRVPGGGGVPVEVVVEVPVVVPNTAHKYMASHRSRHTSSLCTLLVQLPHLLFCKHFRIEQSVGNTSFRSALSRILCTYIRPS